MPISESVQVGAQTLTFETGRLARQADGAVLVTCGGTVVLVTSVSMPKPRENAAFFPLSCDYVEKTYAAGRIPGNYFRREGRLGTDEILTSRMIDRPCRPLFPKGYMCETQIIALVMSADDINDPAICAMNGASAALTISDIPWDGPIAAVRVGRVEGELVANPTFEQQEVSDLELIVVVGKQGVVMVEGEAEFLPESVLVDALEFAQQAARPILDMQGRLREAAGKPKRAYTPPTVPADIAAAVADRASAAVLEAVQIKVKQDRYARLDEIKDELKAELAADDAEKAAWVSEAYGDLKKSLVRRMIIEKKTRIDGRDYETVRAINTEAGLLPMAHGSAVFTRGETQALATVTLGTSGDNQRVETLRGQSFKDFMLHYNFFPFCTNEAKFLRGAGRREIGHGNLAERGVKKALGDPEFPYTIRVVSEILESNGSSSMATVCAGSMALMAAGVPMKSAVGGIAMGLIKEGDDIAILTDILGDEDHLGDMDFKVIGNRDGISAVQMDIKIDGLTRETMSKALNQARDARLHILDKMDETVSETAPELAENAPRIYTVLINPDRIRDLIGPGGKHIRGIQADTDTKVDVDDSGTVVVAAADNARAQRAIEMIKSYTAEPEIGEIYMGKVAKVVDFGAFVTILPNTDGLVHISELANRRVNRVEDVLREGDEVLVKVIGMDRGKIKLSRKAALAEQEQGEADAETGT